MSKKQTQMAGNLTAESVNNPEGDLHHTIQQLPPPLSNTSAFFTNPSPSAEQNRKLITDLEQAA
jgi:hypothetical protein